MEIVVKRQDQEYGPYTIDEISEYIKSGNIVGDDVARIDGFSDWKTVDALMPPSASRARSVNAKFGLVIGIAAILVAGSALYYTGRSKEIEAQQIQSQYQQSTLPMGLRIAHKLQQHSNIQCVQYGEVVERIYEQFGDTPLADKQAEPILETAAQMCGRAAR